jgi:hypothetical protein
LHGSNRTGSGQRVRSSSNVPPALSSTKFGHAFDENLRRGGLAALTDLLLDPAVAFQDVDAAEAAALAFRRDICGVRLDKIGSLARARALPVLRERLVRVRSSVSGGEIMRLHGVPYIGLSDESSAVDPRWKLEIANDQRVIYRSLKFLHHLA